MIDVREIDRAVDAISGADALLVMAGAGMGVDSGLPDFRGREGFWRAYPAFAKLRLDFAELANPRWFVEDPPLAWGFYGHRLHLYRDCVPHEGFAILRRLGERMACGSFVATSNVDGQFQIAGFDPGRIYEVHGSIHWMQCLAGCSREAFAADGVRVSIDPETLRAETPLPRCPRCGAPARPNILMFGDGDWDSARSTRQGDRLQAWLETTLGARLAIVECGAGLAVPTIRYLSERIARDARTTLLRINPREPEVPAARHVGLRGGALEILREIVRRGEWSG